MWEKKFNCAIHLSHVWFAWCATQRTEGTDLSSPIKSLYDNDKVDRGNNDNDAVHMDGDRTR